MRSFAFFSISTTALYATTNACTDFNFYRYNKEQDKSCTWVAQFKESRCKLTDPSSGKAVDQKCRITCNTCPGSSQPAKLSLGQFCSINSQCQSNRCHNYSCSSSITYPNPSPNSYPNPNSSPNSSSSSNSSSVSSQTSKLSLGQFCSIDSQCQSNRCHNYSCSSSNTYPNPSPNLFPSSNSSPNRSPFLNPNSSPFSSPNSSSSNSKRNKKKNGLECRWKRQCKSNNCDNGICRAKPASMKKRIGQYCKWNYQCASKKCQSNKCASNSGGTEGSHTSPSSSALSPSTPTWSLSTPALKSTGHRCTSSSDCQSLKCTKGVCMGSNRCNFLETESASVPWGEEFYENTVILVFVASGFQNNYSFEIEMKKAYAEMLTVDMFRKDQEAKYKTLYVDQVNEPFCDFDCNGIDRLLCCDLQITRNIANKCFPASSVLQTIVIHNDDKYGGAGYSSDNVAIISKNQVGARLAIHELGHSLFEFGDEYTYGPSTAATKANCDVEGCPKWEDLNLHPTLGKGKLCSITSCKKGQYFSGRNSFMRNMYMHVGVVNERFTCCTFLALTKSTPKYCNKFNFGIGLIEYCKNDYQGYGGSSVYGPPTRQLRASNREFKTTIVNHKAVYNDHVSISLDFDSKDYQISTDHEIRISALFRKHQLIGDFTNHTEAASQGLQNLHRVRVLFQSGNTKELLFADSMPVLVPPLDPFGNSTATLDENAQTSIVYTPRRYLQIAVDKSEGGIRSIDMEYVRIQ